MIKSIVHGYSTKIFSPPKTPTLYSGPVKSLLYIVLKSSTTTVVLAFLNLKPTSAPIFSTYSVVAQVKTGVTKQLNKRHLVMASCLIFTANTDSV